MSPTSYHGGGTSDFLSPKLQINANVKMYSSVEPEGEIHPNALMPEKSFNSTFNMINVQGGSRKLSRIINFAAVQKKSQYNSKQASGTQSPQQALGKQSKFLINRAK
jgi:hypothetical protein